MPTRSAIQAEATQRTAASAAAHDAAAVAVATMTAGLKRSVYNVIAEARHGLVEEEVMQAFELGELARTVLAALLADGAITERGGVYAVMPGAA